MSPQGIDERSTRAVPGSMQSISTPAPHTAANRVNSFGSVVLRLEPLELINTTECTAMELCTQIEGVFRAQRQLEQDEVFHQFHC